MPEIDNVTARPDFAAAVITAPSVVKAPSTKGEPFRLYRRVGEGVYRVRFLLGSSQYDESTLNEEFDLALMVARATYVEVRDDLLGNRPEASERH